MSKYALGQVCEHGGLARKCGICESLRLQSAARSVLDVVDAWDLEDRTSVPMDLVRTLVKPLREEMG